RHRFDDYGPHTRRAVLPRHARRHGDFSLHSRPVSPGPSAGLRVARGRDVHVSRSTRHFKRAEHPATEADTIEPRQPWVIACALSRFWSDLISLARFAFQAAAGFSY